MSEPAGDIGFMFGYSTGVVFGLGAVASIFKLLGATDQVPWPWAVVTAPMWVIGIIVLLSIFLSELARDSNA